MTPAQPFALRLFVPSGLREGMRIGVDVLLGPEPDASGDLAHLGEADDTIWLNQAQMAELFGRERSVITRPVGNMFSAHGRRRAAKA